MLGATCEEDVIGKYPLGFFPAETHGNIQQRLEAMLTTGKNAQRAENQVIRLDGKIIDVEVTAAPLIYKGEKAFQVVIKDISERKAAERELKSSEERFRKAFISHPGIISITTLSEGKYLDVNDNFCKMLEYERSEVIGSPSKELGIFYDNNKRDELLNILKRDGRVVNFEVRVKTKSGKIKTGLFSSEMIEMDGQECLLAQFDDITESKRNTAVTESKLHLTRFALSHSLEELLEETLNEAEKLTDSLIGFYHFVDDDQKNLTLQNWSTQTKEKFCKAEGKGTHYPIDMAGVWVDCTKTGKPVIHNNYASLPHRKGLPDGHAEVIRELVVPVSRNDKIKAILGVGNKQFDYNEKDVETVSLLADMVWDITEFKKIDEELKESEARLREMVTTKDKFFNIIAHDLRSPFNAIMGFSELLEEQMKEKNYEDIEEYSKFIHSASKRAMNLLSNLLEWSRSQTGKIKFNPEYFDLAVLINEVTDLFTDIAAQKSIEIKKVMKPNIPVIADKPMVEIILRNLISNAIKFSNFNTSIVISAELKENETLVSVIDNGVGISPEDINNIFRLDINHSTLGTNKEKGTGLGLLLCKEFIEKHNGKLLIESTLGKGSTFCLNIPKNQ
jgi:PAS domain S-box-containing protein